MKGIVLAGGTGSRLWPITRSISKQLLPIYDKPMIYYPISTLMLAGIREILIITTPHDQPQFKELLGDGSELGVSIQYATQPEPRGLAQAFTIGEKFLAGDSCLMILGDNIFYGPGLGQNLKTKFSGNGAHIFTFEVADPSQYGVLNLDKNEKPISVQEKPQKSESNLAITGLYFFDKRAPEIAKEVKPSERGELEITSVIDWYLQNDALSFTILNRGTTWLDTGTFQHLNDASNFVRLIEERTGRKIGCLEEIAVRQEWINLDSLTKKYPSGSEYWKYLNKLTTEKYD